MGAAEKPQLTLTEVAEQIFGPGDDQSVDQWVQYWDDSSSRNRAILDSFRQIVLIDFSGKHILDIGCGTGGLGETVAEKDGSCYVGGDFHWHVLQFGPSASNAHFVQCSGHRTPLASQSIDYIFAFDVVEHLVGGKPWQDQFFEEIARLLQPLGMAFLTTPNWYYPRDGHTGLIGPQYLPTWLADRYIAFARPSFLKEHNSFSEIQLMKPAWLQNCLEAHGLAFLHELPCPLDEKDLSNLAGWQRWAVRLGLGWYWQAEFWGIVVHRESRQDLRGKLKKFWFYEQHQPSEQTREFEARLDFKAHHQGHQLISGWFWHEEEGFRWTSGEASLYLQASNPHLVRMRGYSPFANKITLLVRGEAVGSLSLVAGSDFEMECQLSTPTAGPGLFKVDICCSTTHVPEGPDTRELGVMVFFIELA